MTRNQRLRIAQETVNILNCGTYQASSGQTVNIAQTLTAACVETRLYPPDAYAGLVQGLANRLGGTAPSIAVSARTTLAAGQALRATYPAVACLNFASAKNPGGGFLNGSQAQEESLARVSGLYATLQTQPAFYQYHRQPGSTLLYSDHVIFSPNVPVFRDDNDALIETPWTTSFLTAAAPNAGAIYQNEPRSTHLIRPALEQRARMMLAVAAHHQCDALVLGAWGCGVFKNDPTVVAEVFARTLAEPPFAGRFAHIEFAIYDTTRDQGVLRAFERVFA